MFAIAIFDAKKYMRALVLPQQWETTKHEAANLRYAWGFLLLDTGLMSLFFHISLIRFRGKIPSVVNSIK